MINITLTGDQVEEVMVKELQLSLDLLFKLDKDEGGIYLEPDYDLLNAIKITLGYYMPRHDWEEYLKGVAVKELAVRTQLTGGMIPT